MPAEYDCEGCGIPVVNVSTEEPPAHGLCAVCAWLSEHEAPERIMELRRRIEPGGWVSERAMRRYRDPKCDERSCDYCGALYRGPAVYCSLDCALADA